MLMFPNADIPVVQLSLNGNLDPQTHLEMGRALASFRDEGVLMIGSGMSFHNMRGYGNPQFGPISDTFDAWLTQTVESDPLTRNERLAHWASAPSARQSHPIGEEEHLLPLLVVAGAASNGIGKKVFTDRVLETTLSAFTFN
jgi:aromatic ring-opening dioxygenase catalytic subunit (LigB family)